MGRESNKRDNSWLLRPKPRTLGQAWQRTPQEGSASESSGAPDARQADWRQLPELPKWPPLPEEDPFASARPHDETSETEVVADGSAYSEQQTSERQKEPPLWNPAAPGGHALSRRPQSAIWQRFRGLSPGSRLGVIIAAVSAVVLICTLASVAALGGGLLNPTSDAARNTPAGQTNGQPGGLTTGNTTPTAEVSPTATTAPVTPTSSSDFTITFTCASGSIGGNGEVCIHTQPNATVSITVRYCDGNFATGKSLRGSTHTNGSGDYTWRWKVTTHCAGDATATVTAKSSGQTITQRTTFTITR